MGTVKEKYFNLDEKACSPDLSIYQDLLQDELNKLDHLERKAIYLRFWIPCSIAQIATELKVNWETADKIIERAMTKMREGFHLNKHYCRNLSTLEGA